MRSLFSELRRDRRQQISCVVFESVTVPLRFPSPSRSSCLEHRRNTGGVVLYRATVVCTCARVKVILRTSLFCSNQFAECPNTDRAGRFHCSLFKLLCQNPAMRFHISCFLSPFQVEVPYSIHSPSCVASTIFP